MKKTTIAALCAICTFAAVRAEQQLEADGVGSYSYVTNGLVALWDGTDNAGYGIHDVEATNWVDLVGKRAFDLYGTSWGATYLQFAGNVNSYGVLPAEYTTPVFGATDKTVEFVTPGKNTCSDYTIVLKGPTSIGVCFGFGKGTYALFSTSANKPGYSIGSPESYDQANNRTFSADYSGSEFQSALVNNANTQISGKDNFFGQNLSHVVIGKRDMGNEPYPFDGRLTCMRVYNRVLSATEKEWNYAVDRVRFHGDDPNDYPVLKNNDFAPLENNLLPAFGEVTASPVANGIRFSLDITSLGEGSSSADIKVAVAPCDATVGAATTITNVSAAGIATFDVKGLVSDLYYNYSLSVVNSQGVGRNASGEALTGGLQVQIDSKSYVDDGLVANWDGIDNAGYLSRQESPTEWCDIVSGRKITLNSVTAETNAIYFTGTTNPYSYGELSLEDTAETFAKRNDMTLEMCSRQDDNSTAVIIKSTLASRKAFGFLFTSNKNTLIAQTGSESKPMFSTTADQLTSTSTWTVVYGNSGYPDAAYCNCVAMSSSGSDYWGQEVNGTSFGVRKNSSGVFTNPSKSHIHSIRLYDGALSQIQREWNMAVDDVRFRGADPRRYTIFTNNLVEVRRETASGLEYSSCCESIRASECDLSVCVSDTGGNDSDLCEVWVSYGLTPQSMTEYAKLVDGLALNETGKVTIAGLEGGRCYRFAVKVHNTVMDCWGEVTVHNPLVMEPYTLDGIGYGDSDDGLKVKVSVSTFNITSATIRVSCDGAVVATQPITAAGTFDLTLAGVHSGSLAAEILSDYGNTTRSVTAKIGATGHVMADFAACASGDDALVLHVGDTVSLPVRVDGTYFQTLNPRVLSYADGILTANDVGIAGVEDNASTLYRTGVFAVVPEPPEGGDVYLYKETSDCAWCDPLAWRKVGSATCDSYPSKNGDVAVFPLTTFEGPVTVGGDVTVSALLIGGAKNEVGSFRLCGNDGATLTFSHPDAEDGKARIYLSSNLHNDKATENFCLNLGGAEESERLLIALARDTVFDLGGPAVANDDYSEMDKANNATKLWMKTFVTVDIPSGRRLVFVGGVPAASSGSGDENVEAFFGDDVRFTGAGTLEYNATAAATLAGNCLSNFEGTVSSGMRNFVGQRILSISGPFHVRLQNAGSVTFRTAGFLATNFDQRNSCGVFTEGDVYGNSGTASLPGNAFAGAGLVLDGGQVSFTAIKRAKANFHPIYDTDGETILDYECLNETAKLDVSSGFTMIDNSAIPPSTAPISTFRANSLLHAGSGAVILRDENVVYDSTAYRVITEIKGTADHVVGYAGEPDFANDVYPIVPWMLVRYSLNGQSWSIASIWAAFKADGQLTRDSEPASVVLDEVTDTNRNVLVDGTGIALTADRTVNSLMLGNRSKEYRLGEGRRLTIRSGALMFRSGGSAIGSSSGGTANGTLVFGGRAYVYPYQLTNAGEPNSIYSSVIAPQGMVVTYPGYFALGGDQTGIDGELTVNAGVTYLGSSSGSLGCQLDVPVRVVGGNTKLVVTKPNGETLKNRVVYLDGPGGIMPKLELPAGTTEDCRRLYLDGKVQSRGVYGAIGSGAQYERAFITGTGFLNVKTDRIYGVKFTIR